MEPDIVIFFGNDGKNWNIVITAVDYKGKEPETVQEIEVECQQQQNKSNG